MNPANITAKRLSDDSSTSCTSPSSPEEDQQEGANAEAMGGNAEPPADHLTNPESHMKWLMSFKEISGMYTDDDPDFANDEESETPPMMLDYEPRTYYNNWGQGQQQHGSSGNRGYQPVHSNYRQNYGNNCRGHGNGHQGRGHRGHYAQDFNQSRHHYRDQQQQGSSDRERYYSSRPHEENRRGSEQGSSADKRAHHSEKGSKSPPRKRRGVGNLSSDSSD